MRRIPGIRRAFRHERGTDVDVELQFHIDTRTDELVAAGMGRDEARRVALAEFGDVSRYENETLRIDRGHARATRVKEFLWSVWYDFGYSLRGLRRSPGFALAAVLTLALGIGANTAVWTILDSLMQKALPVDRPDELHSVVRPDKPGEYLNSFPRFERLQSVMPDPRRLAAMSATARMYATNGDQPEPVNVQLVSGNWFQTIGVGLSAGRFINDDDDRSEAGSPVAVLSDGFWTRRFGRDASVIGKTIRVNGVPIQVIGVAEPGFHGLTVGSSMDIWMPLSMQSSTRYVGNYSANNADTEKPWRPQDGISWLTLIARVAPDAATRVSAALDRQLRGELEQQVAQSDSVSRAFTLREHMALSAIPRGFSPLRDQFKDSLRVLMASVGLVLLISCANLAGLLLARSAARNHEIAVRISLGARRGRLVRQVLTDSLTIAFLGGASSLLVARWGTAMLLRAASSGSRAIPLDVSIDLRVITFAFSMSLLTGLVVGLFPALRVSQAGLYDAFRASGRVIGAGAHRLPLGRALVMSQIALSLVLVVTAGVFVKTLQNLLNIDPGYDREHVLVARVDTRAAGYQQGQLPALYDQLLAGASSIPGAKSASLSLNSLAGGGVRVSGFKVPGRTLAPDARPGQENFVTPDYFSTIGIKFLQGRGFTRSDNDGAPKVAIISETAARKYFGTDKVVGERIGYDEPNMEIVGVVRDVRANALREEPTRLVFRPLAQTPGEHITSIEVRVSGATAPVATALRAAIRKVDPQLPVREVVTLAELLERGLSRERLVARLAGSFGVLALLLAAIGLYGVMGYSVSRRTNEMGVRLALGASPAGVRMLVLRESLVLCVAGIVLGFVLLLPVKGLTGRLVYGMSPRDPGTVVIATGILLVVTAAAAFIPAWRASRIDPVDAIRSS